ncbi:MAG: acetyltransferase [Bacteroidota bacterium]
MEREKLIREYFDMGNKLESLYPGLNFKNHCYWRIALDNFFAVKWDLAIGRPAYKNLNSSDLKEVVGLLNSYQDNRSLLLAHNRNSLNLRHKKV